MDQTGCSVHSALQGRWGLTSPRQRLTGSQLERRKRKPPEAESILNRRTSKEEKGEEERRLPWHMKMSPERRNPAPLETINSSLQWHPEGARARGGHQERMRRKGPCNQEKGERTATFEEMSIKPLKKSMDVFLVQNCSPIDDVQ